MLSVTGPVWELPDMTGDEILRGQALYEALMGIKPAKLKETDWAVKAGVNRGFFTNLKDSQILPRRDNLLKLLNYINRSEADLYGRSEPRPSSNQQPTRSVDAGETAPIIRLDLSLPMGPGATVDDYIEEEPVEMDIAYLRTFTKTPPHRLRLARGVGDSMWPTLQAHDEVWIDSTRQQLNLTDKVWAVSINGGAAIKRLRPLKGGKILVISDNPGPGHENYEVDRGDVRIGGLIIKYSRDI